MEMTKITRHLHYTQCTFKDHSLRLKPWGYSIGKVVGYLIIKVIHTHNETPPCMKGLRMNQVTSRCRESLSDFL